MSWWEEQHKPRLGCGNSLGKEKSPPKEQKRERGEPSQGAKGLPTPPPQVVQFRSHGRLWHKAAGLPVAQMAEGQVPCVYLALRRVTLRPPRFLCTTIPAVQMRRWRPREIKEWLSHDHMTSKEKGGPFKDPHGSLCRAYQK